MSERPPLLGRSALVTGASRGIGERVAERLAGAGAHVWALARSERPLRELAGRVDATPLPADLEDDASVWEAMERLQEELGGPPDVVINAAGVFSLSSCAEETVGSFDRHIAVNLRGPFLVIRALLPAMLERGDGLIVNIGSVAGRRPYPGNAAYSASKFGLRGLHQVLLEEIRGSGVRATLLEPAATDTTAWDPIDPDSDPSLPDRIGMLSVGEVAEAVLYVVTQPANVRIPALQIEHS